MITYTRAYASRSTILKIEEEIKVNIIALVVKAYRQAIDLYCEDQKTISYQSIVDEMYKVSHRISYWFLL